MHTQFGVAIPCSSHVSRPRMSWLKKLKRSRQYSQRVAPPIHGSAGQSSHTSGASTRTLEHENGTKSECVPLWSLKPVFTVPIHSGTRELESQSGEDDDQGTVTRGGFRYPDNILAFIDIDQSRLVGASAFRAMMHRRPRIHFSPSKPP